MNNGMLSYFATAILVFLFVRLLVRWAINGGLVSEIYVRLIHPRRMAKAYQKADAGLVLATLPDDEEYRAKLEELLAIRANRRLLAIKYFEQKPTTKELVNKLSEIIPRQRRDDVRVAMVHLLCRSMLDLQATGQIGQSKLSKRRDIQIRIMPWSLAISIWLTILIMIGVGLIFQPTLSVTGLFVTGLLTFIFATIPLLIVVHNRSRVIQYSLAFLAIILGGLWWYADTAHSGLDITLKHSLSSYGFPQLDVEIRYPRWLTAEDMNTCSKPVVINLFGDPTGTPQRLEASLDFDHRILYAVDEKCAPAQSLIISPTNKFNSLVLAALKPLNTDGLSAGAAWVTLYIRDLDKSEKPKPIIESTFFIQLEEPIWNTIRDFCRGAFGVTTASALALIAYDRFFRKKDKV